MKQDGFYRVSVYTEHHPYNERKMCAESKIFSRKKDAYRYYTQWKVGAIYDSWECEYEDYDSETDTVYCEWELVEDRITKVIFEEID